MHDIFLVLQGIVIGGVLVEIRHLFIRVKKLEEASLKRINYRALEDIENAGATMAVVGIKLEEAQAAYEAGIAWLARAHNPTEKK